MKKFSDFNITTTTQGLLGDKIKIDRILNREITVEDYRIENSKFEGKGKRLDLQIKLGSNQHVVFTSGKALIDALEQLGKEVLPFTATIVKENDRLEFR